MIALPAHRCHRCGQAPKLPKQRVCRGCLTGYQRDRRARRRQQAGAVAGGVVLTPVTQPASILVERPAHRCWQCGTASWWEWDPGQWRCAIDGTPA